MISLKDAVRFHGHLGPYLVLGLLAGELALKRLRLKKYFGLELEVFGADKKPKSCFIDGLQLSTGATYGKGNIRKINGKKIKIRIKDLKNNKKIELNLKEDIAGKLDNLNSHKDSEAFAWALYKTNPLKIFNLTTKN